MGIGNSRVGDTTVGTGTHGLKCCPHTFTGTIIQGSTNVTVNGRPAARKFDLTAHACPHCGVGIIIGGSQTVVANGIGTARVGDAVNEICGNGVIINGSGNVTSG